MKVLLLNDNSAHPNWGAQATPYALVRLLERSIPGVEIVCLSWDWLRRFNREFRVPPFRGMLFSEECSPFVRPVLFRLSERKDFYPRIADDFDACADEWMAGRGGPEAAEFLRLAGEADIIVYNGENSIYRATVEGCHALYLLWLARTRLGKAACIVNHTAHLDDVLPIMNGIVRLVHPALDLAAVREPRSLRNLEGLGVKNAVLYPDIVFAEEPDSAPTAGFQRWSEAVGLDDGPYFCLSASGLPMSAPRGAWDGAVGDLVRAIQSLGVRPVLLARDPHCQFLEEVARRVGGIYFGPEHEFRELWSLFRGAAFSVTGHFHYIIFGAMVGCPFVPMTNNNHKVSGACELLQWHRTEPFDATWLKHGQAEIVAEARRILNERVELSRSLIERSNRLRSDVTKLGERIAEIARRANGERAPATVGPS
jgi:hypothetical protein